MVLPAGLDRPVAEVDRREKASFRVRSQPDQGWRKVKAEHRVECDLRASGPRSQIGLEEFLDRERPRRICAERAAGLPQERSRDDGYGLVAVFERSIQGVEAACGLAAV